MGATGESVRRVTDYGYDPAWSPDGRELIVATEPVRDPMARAGNSQLWAVRTSGEGKRLVSKGDGVGPKWSPDGRWVAFWGLRPSTWHRDLWMIAADGSGTPVALTDDASIDWGVEWSPDGRFLYFSSNRGGTMSLLRIPIDPRSGGALGAQEPVTTPAAWAGSLSLPFRARVRPARPSPDSASRDGAKRVPRNARSRDPWSPIRTPTPRRGRRSMRP
jgi:WD40 repeat protein